ncbi:histidine kinase [Puteibacter caeruleilacunae]|nr:histidine kinase [Puteibacter caeruleilacunae]
MPVIKRKIWLPIVIWGGLFLFVFNIVNYYDSTQFAFIVASLEIFSAALIFYLTSYVLFPRYYHKGSGYLMISLAVALGLSLIFVFIDVNFTSQFKSLDDHDPPPAIFIFIRNFFNLGFAFFAATSVKLMDHTAELKESEKLLKEEKLETELKLLKAQINPHFIFNALNNIYSLTYMQSQNAPDSVLKLSDMLRYVFYECNKDRVPIQSEINYIRNFTAFQQMKSDYEQRVDLHVNIGGGNVEIAPMLFVPLIENAFKYSRIEEDPQAFVCISVNSEGDDLSFTIENSMPASLPASGSGMGIKNVKHRLDIIYPGRYDLMIDEGDDMYRVELNLKV